MLAQAPQVIFSSIGDGNCAYNTAAMRIVVGIQELAARQRLVDPSSETYLHYQAVLDLVNQRYPALMPAEDGLTVEQRINQFLQNLAAMNQGETNWLWVQQILAPAFRAYVAEQTSIAAVTANSAIALAYKQSIKTKVINCGPAFPNLPDFEGMPYVLNGIRPIVEAARTAIYTEIGGEENLPYMPLAHLDALWAKHSAPALGKWFEDTGYKAYLDEVNTNGVNVGFEQYQVFSRLFGLVINYSNPMGVVQQIDAAQILNPIVLNAQLSQKRSGDHWDLSLNDSPLTSALIAQYNEQRLSQARADEIVEVQGIIDGLRLEGQNASNHETQLALLKQVRAHELQQKAEMYQKKLADDASKQALASLALQEQERQRQVQELEALTAQKKASVEEALRKQEQEAARVRAQTKAPAPQKKAPIFEQEPSFSQGEVADEANDFNNKVKGGIAFIAASLLGFVYFNFAVIFLALCIIACVALAAFVLWKNWDNWFGTPQNTHQSTENVAASKQEATYAFAPVYRPLSSVSLDSSLSEMPPVSQVDQALTAQPLASKKIAATA